MLARVSANCHWTKVTSGVFILFFTEHLSKQTMWIFYCQWVVTYLIFHNISWQPIFVYLWNRSIRTSHTSQCKHLLVAHYSHLSGCRGFLSQNFGRGQEPTNDLGAQKCKQFGWWWQSEALRTLNAQVQPLTPSYLGASACSWVKSTMVTWFT